MFLYYFFYSMKLYKVFIFVVCFVVILTQVFWNLLFSEIFPNTDDDTNLEYFELFNDSDNILFLSWYILKDKSWKEYIFDDIVPLNPKEKKKYYRILTKILLNDTDEELFLYDSFWNLLDTQIYSSSENNKSIVILEDEIIDENEETWTWTTDENEETWTWTSDENEETWTWTIDENEETWTWITDENEKTWTWTIHETNNNENILVPEIDYIFQSPSYLLEKDDIVSEYNCDSSKEECKINIDLRNSFSWDFNESDFNCIIDFWFETWEENKCNPWTIIMPIWTKNFNLKIISKNDINIFSYKSIKIVNKWYVKPVASSSNVYINNVYTENTSLINITKPEIIIQSWINNDNQCINNSSCSINLLYDIKNSKERCLWDFWNWVYEYWTELKCNPWYIKYSTWNFIVKLKVYQDWNLANYSINELSFTNVLNIETKDNEEKVIDIKINNINEEKNNIINELITSISNSDYKGLKIYKVESNPSWSDDMEYIELINKSEESINLYSCSLDDLLDWWSKIYNFLENEIILKWETKKYYKELTKLNLNNNWDEVNLFCNNNLIDSLVWNYKVAEWETLDHTKLDILLWKAKVLEVLNWNIIKLQFMESKKVENFRLAGLNSFEINNTNPAVKKFWQETYDYVNDNIMWEEIEVEINPNNYRDDKSNLFGVLYLNWENFNKKLIEQWYAGVYKENDFKYNEDYIKAETVAKKNNLWFWALSWVEQNNIEEKTSKNEDNTKLKSIITIQWTVWKNKLITWNTITCMDTCSLNFDWTESIWNIKKYSWDFWNWLKFEWKNPKTIKYEKFWNYKVYLVVLSESWELNIWNYIVNFYQTPKKEKISTSKSKTSTWWNDYEKDNKYFEQDDLWIDDNGNSMIYYIFIFIFWIVLIVLLLWKEKLF